MTVAARIVVASFLTSCVAAIAALLTGVSWWKWLAAPALFLSGWAAAGHLITLDDDLPGGWSNPGESKWFWYRSLAEFLCKVAVFGALIWFVTEDWSR